VCWSVRRLGADAVGTTGAVDSYGQALYPPSNSSFWLVTKDPKDGDRGRGKPGSERQSQLPCMKLEPQLTV
jgi:hypothetical protein